MPSKPSERGLTLIEVLVAVVILAATTMTIFTIYNQSMVDLRRAKNRTFATQAAQTMLEMILSSPYPASAYHGLTTASDAPTGHPAAGDWHTWKTILAAFPTAATGTIAVQENRLTYGNLALVTIMYSDYGRDATRTFALVVAKDR